MRKLMSLMALFAITFAAVPVWAQPEAVAQLKMKQFKQSKPDARFYGKQYFDDEGFIEQDGTADMIYGTVLATGDSPEASAWNFYQQIEGIYAQEIGTLLPNKWASGEVLQGVMWNKTTQTHGFYTFRFNQTIGDIPVFRSGVGFLVRNEAGFPVVMSANNLKEMAGFDIAAAANVLPKATQVMIDNTSRMMDDAVPFQGAEKIESVLDGVERAKPLPISVSDEQLVVWAGVTNVRVAPELAISFMAERGDVSRLETYGKHLVVAAVDNGEILYSVNQVVADVDGTVSAQVTDGTAALECEPVAPFALPYGQVQILGGSTVFADENGNFNIPSGVNGDVTVRSPLRGQYFEVFDDTAGGSTPFIDVTVANGGSVNILHNPNPTTEFPTSNVNCYYRANEVRDFVLSFEPTFPTIASQTFFDITSNNDNISGITSCNATYNGSAINFMRNIGSCNNTSIADVVYHEYGHHLVAVSGNNQGQFGEGSGDTMGVLIEDHPELGEGFFEGDCNNGIRSAENFRTYPCNGPIHDCGQLLSGCVWDTMNEIRAIDPDNARDIVARLFIGMFPVRGSMGGSSTIGPEITLIFLLLDDDDGSIGNGTPHYQQIADAFNAHNMMAPEIDAIDIILPNGVPELIDPNGGTSFQVDVAPITSTPVAASGILHVNSGGGFVQIPMTVIDADSYSAVFPAIECGSEVSFFVTVDAQNGDTLSRPEGAPATTFNAISASGLSLSFSDSFDTNLSWAVSGDAADGQWERGIPNNGDRGDPAFDAEDDGAGYCFVTDNGNTPFNTNTDVDDGSTILTSPVMDATSSPDQIAFISYFRWYSNTFGASPMADIFVVDISNNGGSTWTNLETVGPGGPEVSGGWIRKQFRISDFVTPTNNMRIRFNASDLGAGSVVEAGVDAVQVQIVECSEDILVGDVNLDGVVNLLDVAPFIELISNGGFQPEADVNMDGVVNLLDVAPFIDLLSGG